jgi:hypothetical protein
MAVYHTMKKFGVCQNFREHYKYEKDEEGNPLTSECAKQTFVLYYSSAESLELFDSLYQNKHGLQDKFVAYWEVLAKRWANNSNVMGFDPLNEPMVSNFVHELSLLKPKVFDLTKLQPLYSRIFEIYRKYNRHALIHFETAQAPNIIALMGGIVRPAGFSQVPGNDSKELRPNTISISSKYEGEDYSRYVFDNLRPIKNYTLDDSDFFTATEEADDAVGPEREEQQTTNAVLHDHFYCCQMEWSMCNKHGEPLPDEKSGQRCQDWHRRRMNQRQEDAKKLNVPLMITEFGACYETATCAREIRQVLDECERTLCAGWAYWQFKQYRDHTTVGDQGMQGFYNAKG